MRTSCRTAALGSTTKARGLAGEGDLFAGTPTVVGARHRPQDLPELEDVLTGFITG